VVALALVVGSVSYVIGGRRLNQRFDVEPELVAIPAGDSAAIARGRHLASAVTFCHACHGEDLSGSVMMSMPGMLTLAAPNLTSGQGGAGARLGDADYIRAIRHGINTERRGLLIMHADAYHNLSRDDLAAIVAYVKSVPPVDQEIATRVAPLGRVMIGLGLFDSEQVPPIPAEVIDHDAPFVEAPPADTTADYGRYLVSISLCTMCHGRDLKGAPPIDPAYAPGPNILYRAAPGGWTREQFATLLRTGVAPDGRSVNGEWMPWEVYAALTDEEITALWLRLEELARISGRSGSDSNP
jgi:cytochrome c553